MKHTLKNILKNNIVQASISCSIIIMLVTTSILVQASIGDPEHPQYQWKTYPYHPIGSSLIFPTDEGAHNTDIYPVEWWYANFQLIGKTTGKKYGAFVAFYSIKSQIFEHEELRLFSISDVESEQTYSNAKIGTLSASTDHLDLSFQYINNYNENENQNQNQNQNLNLECPNHQMPMRGSGQTEINQVSSLNQETPQAISISQTAMQYSDNQNIVNEHQQSTPAIGDDDDDGGGEPIFFEYDYWYTKTDGVNLLPFEYTLSVGGTAQQDNQPMELTVDMECIKKPLMVGGDGLVSIGLYGGISYYYSLTQLNVTGTLTLRDITESVVGIAWIDHQWGNFTNPCPPPKGLAVTYEWFSIKLDDHQEINVGDTWDRNTGIKINQSFTDGLNFVDSYGTLELLEEYQVVPLTYWADPISCRRFACQWKITEPSKSMNIMITPVYLNQTMLVLQNFPRIQQFLSELFPGFGFWEGTCRVEGSINGVSVTGNAYVELTHSYDTIIGADFFLPEAGGGMVHSTSQMTDNIRLPVPTENVEQIWYNHEQGGEMIGTFGNGLAGNGNIAAASFNNIFGVDNLIIYDYDGNRIWSSGSLLNPWGLNAMACSSTPMVDIHNRVVACDNRKIILVNASDQNNVFVEWISEIPYKIPLRLKDILDPIPFSPNIVENRTIILPTSGGPLLAYDVRTGEKLAEIYLGKNTRIDPYYGLPEMTWSDFMTILLKYKLQSLCPYHYNGTSDAVEWVSSIPYGIMPFTPPFFEGPIRFETKDKGLVQAIDIYSGEILASNYIENPGIITGDGYFSTINSACVKGNMIYLVTEYKKPGYQPWNDTIGRLYAVRVNPDAPNREDRLTVIWNYTYFGKSQASPTMIGDTIYFDGYNNTWIPSRRDPHIYAVYSNGTEKWKVRYPNATSFSFSMDPRGGFWYEDCGIPMFGNGGRKLVRFYEENGSIDEEINMSELIDEDGVICPISCMTMCGTESNPIMLISANRPNFQEGKWVVAVDLNNSNNLLWKIPVDPSFNLNYAGGQYTILMKNNVPRILFQTWLGGVVALGSNDGDDDQGGQGESIPKKDQIEQISSAGKLDIE